MDTSAAAALVRTALRNAGCREEAWHGTGFLVEGDPQGGWVVVGCYLIGKKRRSRALQNYRDILSAAGFDVTDSPRLPGVLRVSLPPDAAEDQPDDITW